MWKTQVDVVHSSELIFALLMSKQKRVCGHINKQNSCEWSLKISIFIHVMLNDSLLVYLCI